MTGHAVRLAMVAALAFILTGLAQADFKFSGYTQVRYNFWDADYANSKHFNAFQARRVRLKAVNAFNDDTSITLQLDFGAWLDDEAPGTVQVKDAVITHKLSPEWNATLGFMQMPFGYEVPSSDSANRCFEKSQVMNQFFPGERDTGLYLHFTPAAAHAPRVDFGVSNGLKKWYDTTTKTAGPAAGTGITDTSARDRNDRALVGRLSWALPNGGTAGLSYMKDDRSLETTTRTSGDATADPATGPTLGVSTTKFHDHVWGAHVRYQFPNQCALQGEYFSGKLLGMEASGWYALGEYKVAQSPTTVFYRYDTFDNGKALSASNNPDFNRHTLGVTWDRNANERATFQVEKLQDNAITGGNRDYTNFGVQYQVKY